MTSLHRTCQIYPKIISALFVKITQFFSVTQRISARTETQVKSGFILLHMAVCQGTMTFCYSGNFYFNKKTPSLQ